MTRMSHRYWPDHPETDECVDLGCRRLPPSATVDLRAYDPNPDCVLCQQAVAHEEHDERDEWDRWNTVRDACAAYSPQALEDFEHIRADAVRDRTVLADLRGGKR